jgi:hypothetical protein
LVTLSLPALADECCPDDPDFDGANCTLNGGTILPTGCGGGGPAATVPIDGGASIFAGIATIYGVRRLRKKRKK